MVTVFRRFLRVGVMVSNDKREWELQPKGFDNKKRTKAFTVTMFDISYCGRSFHQGACMHDHVCDQERSSKNVM